jgi:hypothetical protein
LHLPVGEQADDHEACVKTKNTKRGSKRKAGWEVSSRTRVGDQNKEEREERVFFSFFRIKSRKKNTKNTKSSIPERIERRGENGTKKK